MSRMINKRDINNSRKRATINTLYTSTPTSITNTSMKHCSISLSEIDTASSSSGRENLQLHLQERKRHTKGKKREDTKWRMKDSDDSKLEAKQKQLIDESLNVKRKKNLRSEKKAIKRKRILEDTDNEWETETEESINEPLIGSRGSIDDECIKLFQDPPCTPEKIRNRPIAYEEILHNYESPIIGSCRRKRLHLISKKNDIILQDTLLPVNSLTTEVRSLEETKMKQYSKTMHKHMFHYGIQKKSRNKNLKTLVLIYNCRQQRTICVGINLSKHILGKHLVI
ncbi:uncharacterized protein [Temnothorax nylanderi]|uniref:uncharacterized protein n=1 Tax=Temnothorax nylanderi TaxID=102681 RepID=UPI003A849ED5